MFKENRPFILLLCAFALLVAIGIAGYAILLGVGFVDALYMTVITISTVGYKEVAPMTPAAEIFSIFVIIAGLGLAGYSITSIVAFVTEGRLSRAWRKRQMDSRIAQLEGHYIVCGAGETGQNVIADFRAQNVPFVVVDMREEKIQELHDQGLLAILGDPTHEAALKQARIERAIGLVSALSSDAENIYTVLTARFLNHSLFIVSRAIEPHAHEKLCMAGADRTVSPNQIGGRRMAAMMLRPTIFSFLDTVTSAGREELSLEEVTLQDGSPLAGQLLSEARIPDQVGLNVLALRKGGSEAMVFNPGSETRLAAGDAMVVLGSPEKVDRLRGLALDSGKPARP